jgi:urease subunit gamma/beta
MRSRAPAGSSRRSVIVSPPRYDAGMRLTAWEEERLLIFTAAELARRHRDRGLLLNAPEAVALMCDAMLETARGGALLAEVEMSGRAAVAPDQVLPGVAALIPEVRLEVLMDDGGRLVVLVAPLGPVGEDAPGAVRPAATRDRVDRRGRIEIEVRNTSRRAVRVSSHYPFERVNRRLEFDRAKAAGCHLDIDAGSTERWAPGETRTVPLVRTR